jgi:hypothetical protein
MDSQYEPERGRENDKWPSSKPAGEELEGGGDVVVEGDPRPRRAQRERLLLAAVVPTPLGLA